MSFEITCRCDGLVCGSERFVDDLQEPAEWGEHDGFHYCSTCWPKVQEEIKEQS